jgi:hypothetical protein
MQIKQSLLKTSGAVFRSDGACGVQYAEVTPETIRILVHSFYETLRQHPISVRSLKSASEGVGRSTLRRWNAFGSPFS